MKRQKGNTVVIVLVLIMAAAVIGFLVYQNMQLRKQTAATSPTPAASTTLIFSPTPIPTPTLKPGWKLYQNNEYNFEFSYPASYKVLVDKENLYGWPKAILLLYKGGQSYDLAIEIWNTEAEYKAKYTDTSVFSVFKTEGGKFITLANLNNDAEVKEIIESFKFTD